MKKQKKTTPAKPPRSIRGTATPIGWSFYSTFLRCKFEWFLRYFRLLRPLAGFADYFALGSVYHAVLEGVPDKEIESWGPQYARFLEEGKRLAAERRRPERPRLPPFVWTEKLYEAEGTALEGIFTSRPDGMERPKSSDPRAKLVARDFKSARTTYDLDDVKWHISGSVLGELYATGADEAVVDIIGKGKETTVALRQVMRTPQKMRSFELTVLDAAREIWSRVSALRGELADRGESDHGAFSDTDDIAEKHFPRNNDQCARAGGGCPYYDFCWKGGDRRSLYVTEPKTKESTEWLRRLEARFSKR